MPSVRQPPKQRSRTGWAIRVLRWFTTTGICGLTIVSGGCSQSTSFRATRCCAAINLNRRCLEKAKRDEGREPAGEMKKLTICLSFCPSDGYKANRLPQLPAKQGVAEGVSCSSGEGGNKTPRFSQSSIKSTVACKLFFLQEFASNQSSTVGDEYHRLLRSRFSTNLSQNGGGRLRYRSTLLRLSSIHGEACRCI